MSLPNKAQSIAILGSGPAALMTADRLAVSGTGAKISIFEKRAGIAWKLFVAGSSGLNITNDADADKFPSFYTGPLSHWRSCFKLFANQDWIQFLEQDLGQKTFLGTSGRYFVETMHAALLVKAWKKRLESLHVEFHLQHEFTDLVQNGDGYSLSFANGSKFEADKVVFCLGGGSYEPTEHPIRWLSPLTRLDLEFTAFSAVNTGYHVAWPEAFLAEADGLPLKNVTFTNARGSRKGDLIVTEYGLEGTPVYTLGEPGAAWIDLKPDLSYEAILKKLRNVKENLSPMRRIQKVLGFNKAALALIFHLSPSEWRDDLETFSKGLKQFPLMLLNPRPLAESISSRGGLAWANLDSSLQLLSYKNVYAAGEMIDWEAPTGGFLIQGAVSQGAFVADQILSSFPK